MAASSPSLSKPTSPTLEKRFRRSEGFSSWKTPKFGVMISIPKLGGTEILIAARVGQQREMF